MGFRGGLLRGGSRQLGLGFRLSGSELRPRSEQDDCSGESDEECSFHVRDAFVVRSLKGECGVRATVSSRSRR
jgi:hypothetical protein